MVSPLVLLGTPLGMAFLLGMLQNRWRFASYGITLLTMTCMSLFSADWVLGFASGSLVATDFSTAGAPPPFAISLRMSLTEASLILLVNLAGLFSTLYLKEELLRIGRRGMAVLLIDIMALCGIILTRDIFNLFVFFELVVISTGGLVLLSDDQRAPSAGFKYLIVSQLISVLLLIGIIFAYHSTGTLNIDGMAAASLGLLKGGALAFFLILIAVISELKPFPANGWALDIYESAHPAFSAIFSAAASSAALFAVAKLLPMGGESWLPVVSSIGLVSFLAANLFALCQENDRRLLGYSSIAQTGLVLVVIGQQDILGERYLFIAGGILLAHAVAKAGLYWLSGLLSNRHLTAWTVLRQSPLLLFAFISFIALLVGLPPFPGFYAKWELVHLLAQEGRLAILGLVLLGALVEAGYLFRWFGKVVKRSDGGEEAAVFSVAPIKTLVVFAAVAGGWSLGYLWGQLSLFDNILHTIPVLFALGFLLLERFPVWLKNSLAIVGLVSYYLISYPAYDPMQLIFGTVILIGGGVILLASYSVSGRRMGFYPSAMLMFAGLSLLIEAKDSFHFFVAWELLTIGSYFLILRGKQSEPHALSYLVFSLGGAFLILAGFALAAEGVELFPLSSLSQVTADKAPWVFILLAVGFMTKTASVGLHIWLPGAHAEAETDVSPMVSGILLKAGLYGLVVLLLGMGKQQLYGVELTHVMLWIGALSALLGNLMAVFQEDAKRLLAYSSIGQMGYALFGLALMNHLGWLMALMFVINHYIYKSMLFLSVGGVAKRTGTRLMYQMGGLITLMPLSFIAVLIGIIAVSGVPPLSGFGGRWIFYNAILTAEYRLPIILIFLAGPIAFLYLFRLIHTLFLGQLKDEHRQIKEAPFWLIVPQMIFVACLMAFALVPGVALRRFDLYLNQFFPQGGLNWEGVSITSQFGYWSPVSIMVVVMVIFASLLGWLIFVNRKAQKVKQFNMVFAAERPYRPETTHFAWNFFAPYKKALGFLIQPLATRFWGMVMDLLHTSADLTRRFYTGNGQTYAIHLLAFVVVVYLFSMGSL
ncbi:MAG: NADH-quinone oxidoreductase subunit F [Magnetococcales bacterium]|nr:NADH-quinone oxidoreductase subunit F [Magnetococcales bacterium]